MRTITIGRCSMELFDYVKQLVELDADDAIKQLKERDDFSSYTKNDALFNLQPEGNIYKVVTHNVYLKNGDCITYTIKEKDENASIQNGGTWDCYWYAKQEWYRLDEENQKFIVHDTYRRERKEKPKFSKFS